MNPNLQEFRLRNLRAAARCTAKAKAHGRNGASGQLRIGYRVCRVHGARGGAPRGSRHGNYTARRQRTRETIEARRSVAELLRMARDLCEEI